VFETSGVLTVQKDEHVVLEFEFDDKETFKIIKGKNEKK